MATLVAVGLDRWSDRGLCRGHDEPDLWFPFRRDSREAARAKAWCETCPVQLQCLTEALELEALGVENEGIWGGLDKQDRDDLRRRRR